MAPTYQAGCAHELSNALTKDALLALVQIGVDTLRAVGGWLRA